MLTLSASKQIFRARILLQINKNVFLKYAYDLGECVLSWVQFLAPHPHVPE